MHSYLPIGAETGSAAVHDCWNKIGVRGDASAAALDAAVDILPLARIAPTLTGLLAAYLNHSIQT